MCGVELGTAVLRSDGMWPWGYAKHNSHFFEPNLLLKRRDHVSTYRLKVHFPEQMPVGGVVSC
jgi:hypothetical protein